MPRADSAVFLASSSDGGSTPGNTIGLAVMNDEFMIARPSVDGQALLHAFTAYSTGGLKLGDETGSGYMISSAMGSDLKLSGDAVVGCASGRTG